MTDSLPPYELQHTRLPCHSLSPEVCSNSCPLSQWCYQTISPFVFPFSSCPQSFPASGCFPMHQLFISGGQNNGVSVSVLPMSTQGWFLLALTLLTRDSLESSPAQYKSSSSSLLSLLYGPIHIWHDYWKNHSFDYEP